MKYLLAEFIKLRKVKFIWGMSLICIVICAILFTQYTLNESSGIAEPLLKQPQNNASFFLEFFSALLAYFWAVCIGSYLSTSEYKDGTIITHIQNSGRYYGVLSKVLAFLILTCVQIIILFFIGYILSGLFFGFSIRNFLFKDTLAQILLSVLATFSLGLMGMTVGRIFKSAMVSNILCLGIIFGLSAFPGVISKYAFYLNPFSYLSPSFKLAFSNISGMSSFRVMGNNLIHAQIGIIYVICLSLIMISGQLILSRFEQY